MKKETIYAFIDSQNLNLAIRDQGWKINFGRLRIYLKEKYHVSKAFIFIGYIEKNQKLYEDLKENGFILVFKPTLTFNNRKVKGNVDAELVLHTMIEFPHYSKALIITGDGDFYCLVEYLQQKNKLESILIPNRLKFSALLKRKLLHPYLKYMNDLEGKVGYKKKSPRKDKTSQGTFSVRDRKSIHKRTKKVK